MNHQPNIQESVYLERVKLFFGHATGNMVRALMGGLLIAIVLWSGGTNDTLIVIWLAVITIFSILTYMVDLSFKKIDLDITIARTWLIRRIVAGSLVGMMYGISPFLITAGAGVETELFLFIILSTLVAVASVGYSVMPVYYLILDAICLGPITLSFFNSFDTINMVMLATSIIWQLVVLKKALHISRSTIEALYTNERLQHEIEERKMAEQALRESEDRFKTLSGAAFDGVIITENGRIIDTNKQFENITGYNREELENKNVFEIIADEYVDLDLMKNDIAAESETLYEITGSKKNKEKIILEVRGKNLSYKDKNLRVSVVRDITQKKQVEKELETLATTDTLTGIANRYLGILFLKKQMKSIKRKGSFLTVCFIDVDGLKPINDQYGHEMGDDLIKSSSIILSKALRESDLICRLGGDEFLLIFPDSNIKQASEIWNRICEEIQHFNSSSEKPYRVSFSHGFSEFDPSVNLSADELISLADKEMYKVKKARKAKKQ